MNVWVGALLYQPLEWHLKRVVVPRDDSTKCEDETAPSTTNASPIIITTTAPNGLVTSYEKLDETVIVYNSSTKMVTVSLAAGRRTFNDCKHTSSRPSITGRPSCDSTLGRLHPEYHSQVTLKSITESLGHVSYLSCCYDPVAGDGDESHAVVTLIELFKNPIFIIILISNASTAVGYTNFYIFLPSYAISLRYTKTLSSCLLSVTACFDLIGRIGGATVSDVLPLRKRVYFVAGLAISGLVLIVLPLTRTYVGLCVACATFGLASGTYVGVTVVTMVEMLGEEKLADAYTVSLFVNGLLQMVGPPICGLVYDHWKSFGVIISSLGATVACGASAWILLPLVEAKNGSRA